MFLFGFIENMFYLDSLKKLILLRSIENILIWNCSAFLRSIYFFYLTFQPIKIVTIKHSCCNADRIEFMIWVKNIRRVIAFKLFDLIEVCHIRISIGINDIFIPSWEKKDNSKVVVLNLVWAQTFPPDRLSIKCQTQIRPIPRAREENHTKHTRSGNITGSA